ncbi:MAG: matrixin family metalloprotease [Phycisphaerae bacterium]|nr:matrixin family metalloprotease [Phycisphaerae bacterium]
MSVRSSLMGTLGVAIAVTVSFLSTESGREGRPMTAPPDAAKLIQSLSDPQPIAPNDLWVYGREEDSLLDIVRSLRSPVAYCYAEGTPEEEIVHFEWAKQIAPGPLAYFLSGSWSTVGTPFTLTWSLVPDGLSISSTGLDDNGGVAAPSEMFARMDTLFSGNRALWISLIDQSFERWEQLSGITYTRVTSGGNDWDDGAFWGTGGGAERGDVRLSMRNIDGPSSVLAFNFFPTTSDMVIDRSEGWGSSTNNYRFFRDVVMHELGHGLGMRHVCSNDTNQLMEPFINTSFDGPQHDDLRAIQRQHGDPLEPDDSPAQATDLGSLAAGGSLDPSAVPAPAIPTSGLLSIDTENEQDWFRFQISSDLLVSATVTPQGRTYDNSTQNSNGSCNSGNPFDSLTVANLSLELYSAADLVNPIELAEVNAAGLPESIIDEFVVGPGDYYLRVFETGLTESGETQNYTLQISAAAPPACCLPDGVCEGRAPQDCTSIVGLFYGTSVDCGSAPACNPVDTSASLSIASPFVSAGGSVLAEVFIADAIDLSAYQFQVEIVRTSGTGTISVPCPDGALVNTLVCVDNSTLQPTGPKCDTTPCPGTDICFPRQDFVFANKTVITSPSCGTNQIFAQLNTFGDSVTIGSTPTYAGEFQLEVSPDATVGSTFEVSVVSPAPDGSTSYMTDPSSVGILFQRSAPITVTVTDLAPPLTVTTYPDGARKQRYVSWRPDPGFAGSYAFELSHPLSGQAYYVSQPLTSPPSIVGKGITELSGSASPILYNWSTLPVVHTTGCLIAPGDQINTAGAGHVYEVRSTADGVTFSPPIVVRTADFPTNGRWWADLVGTLSASGDGSTTPPTPANSWTPPNGSVSGFDISAALQVVSASPTAPPLTWTDVNPQLPDHVTTGPDVLRVVNAFSVGSNKEFYPYDVPVAPGDQGQTACPPPSP